VPRADGQHALLAIDFERFCARVEAARGRAGGICRMMQGIGLVCGPFAGAARRLRDLAAVLAAQYQ